MTNEHESGEKDLKQHMFRGSFWMVGVNITRQSIGIVSTIILARLLPPEDFGLVAMATVLMLMMQAMTEFGFDVVLIQKQSATRDHYNTAWTFQVLFALCSAAVLFSLAGPASAFYDEPRVFPIVMTLAVGMVIRGFQNIGIVNFRKDLQFHREYQMITTAKVVSFVVTISTAWITGSYWALVIGILVNRSTLLTLSYVLSPYRPRLSVARRAELFSFSIWLYLSNLLFFISSRGADFIVGKMLGPRALGLFTISQEVSTIPAEHIVGPINRAIYPGYAKIGEDSGRLTAAFMNVTSIIAMIAFPSTLGIAVVSVYAVPVLLGEQWIDAIPIVEILSFVALIRTLHSNTGSVYIVLGRPQLHFYIQIFTISLLIPLAIYLARQYGVLGIGYAYILANGTGFLVNLFVSTRVIGFDPLRLLARIYRPMLASFLMFHAVRWSQAAVFSDLPVALGLVGSIVVGAATYSSAVLGLWLISRKPKGAETLLLEYLERIPYLRAIPAALK